MDFHETGEFYGDCLSISVLIEIGQC